MVLHIKKLLEMSGSKLLADTNSFIGLLSKHAALAHYLEFDWWFSFITEIELLGKPKLADNEVKVIDELLSICTKVPRNEDINRITIALKQKYVLKTPDAMIAATAIYHQLPLLTFDKGFKKLKR